MVDVADTGMLFDDVNFTDINSISKWATPLSGTWRALLTARAVLRVSCRLTLCKDNQFEKIVLALFQVTLIASTRFFDTHEDYPLERSVFEAGNRLKIYRDDEPDRPTYALSAAAVYLADSLVKSSMSSDPGLQSSLTLYHALVASQDGFV